MIKLYIDCTGTHQHNANTGIQRVVRNITSRLLKSGPERGVECVPVICTNGAFFPCTLDEQGSAKQPWYVRLNQPAKKALNAVRGLICTVLPFQPVFVFCYASRYEFGLARIVYGSLSTVGTLLRLAYRLLGRTDTVTPVGSGSEPRILLCADAGFTYLPDLKTAVPPLRAAGTKIVTIIYDLIPINSAAYCSAQFTAAFDGWIRFAIAQSHGLVCISDAVRQELLEYLAQLPDPKPAADKVDYFHLGFQLDRASEQAPSLELREGVFGDKRPVFLMVGTIEPRKNHEFVLRVFESLWRNGKDYKLCFIGRYGWNTGELMERLSVHPERNKRLFVLTNASDGDLQYAYKAAYGLICASLTEGFGLPVVEGLAQGLPVLASDIPVFREIAGSVPVYFSPTDVASLRAAVLHFCGDGRAAACKRAADFSALSWERAADTLLTKLLQIAEVESRTVPQREESDVPPEDRPDYVAASHIRPRSKAL